MKREKKSTNQQKNLSVLCAVAEVFALDIYIYIRICILFDLFTCTCRNS